MNYLKKLKPITILTLFATFLMGFIDAYTFMKKGGVFVSAQTGNMIAFGSKLFTGKFTQAFKHISVFLGFALGTFCGELIYEKVGGSTRRKYKLILLLQSCVLLFFALFQLDLLDFIMVFLLGWLAGFELTLFRKIGITNVNDGVMTGNTKSLMSSLYGWIVDKDLVLRKQFLDVGATILVFILGVGIGSIVVSIHATLSLWISFILTVLFFSWVSISKVQMD